eukprot:1280007-Rhodomonas_salina.1
MFAIIDSGANAHYVCTEDFFTQSRPSNIVINGLGWHQEKAKSSGLIAVKLSDINGAPYNFTAHATYIPSSSVTLLNVGQLCNAGNSVIHTGPPNNGMHGMYL